MRPIGALVAAVFILTRLAHAASPVPDEDLGFNEHIRPILSDRCFRCHGPDDRTREASLRLDRRDNAVQERPMRPPAIIPGDPNASELMRRIASGDPDVRMPPPDSNLSLSAGEIETLRKWIQQGAPYQPHWAFVPVEPADPPAVANVGWVRNEIDRFVLRQLELEGLVPAPEAPKETLIRRVSQDLTGLPPSPAELARYLEDDSTGAYDAMVDRYLASPAYGERRANEWLDLARYADTFGYQADVDVDFSPWRDWVIRAYNENLPYDRFLIWQLAGDLLPNATRDQILATAFNRLHRQTNEGGSIEEEFRIEYVADRVHTMGTAMMGLTLECARCHDHKFDPISQKDYYRLSAYFSHIDESGLYSHFTRAIPTPTLLLESDQRRAERQLVVEAIEQAQRALANLASAARPAFNQWRQQDRPPAAVPAPLASFSFETLADGVTPNATVAGKPAKLSDDPVGAPGKVGQAVRFNGDNAIICEGTGSFGRTDAFTIGLWIKPSQKHDRAVVLHCSRAWTDSGSRGYELLLEDGRPSASLIHFWPGNALKIAARQPLPTGEWTHLALVYDGSSRAAGLTLYRNGRADATEVLRDHLYKDILHRKEWGDSDVGQIHLTLAGRFRDKGFSDGLLDELQIHDRALTALEIRAMAGSRELASDAELFEHYLARHDESWQRAASELASLRAKENNLVNDVPEIMVMEEMAAPRPVHVLRRGSYESPGESVQAGTPEQLPPFHGEPRRDRLGLAEWLTNPSHPLTSRVAANRVWAVHFGRGLVATPNDFGSQGHPPSHPQLLDWLANAFIKEGWDLKALHKRVLLSATYRQRSDASPSVLERDPGNRLLARGPKHRLSAEQIRDAALAAGGLLVRAQGGPSVKPYQPAGLWEESGTGKHYTPSKGDGLYRRSLYTFWRRTSPPPSMQAFDAPSREVCTAQRETTATPLQALVLLNDPQYIEAARALAEVLMKEYPEDLDATPSAAFRRLLTREPTAAEARVLGRLYEEQRSLFDRDPEAADRYLSIGQRPHDAALPAVPAAALTAVINTLMSHDEFVMKR